MTARLILVAGALLASLVAVGAAVGHSAADVRVTVFGDSAATAMAYDPDAKKTLSIDAFTESKW